MSLAVIFSGAAGCQRSKVEAGGTVRGTVTFQSQPIAAGRVMFSNPTRGINAIAPLDLTGNFILTLAAGAGLPYDEYIVCVLPPVIDYPPGPPPPGALVPKDFPEIPALYRDPATTPLKAKFSPSEASFKFDLQPAK